MQLAGRRNRTMLPPANHVSQGRGQWRSASVDLQKTRREGAGRRTTSGKSRVTPPSVSKPKRAAKVRAPRLIVGIGASAGGLEAFKTFFTHMPADSGMAFVLLQHLDPLHKSMLVDLIGRHTAMAVVEAADGMRVAANQVFIISPNTTLTLRDGTLVVREIKECGGLTLAQADVDTTAMGGMPQSAAATGLVDHLIPEAEMPALLVDDQQHLHKVAAQMDVGGDNRRDMPEHLSAICVLVRTSTGHDFSHYKHSTLLRRIQRRMQVLRVDTVRAFIERLRKEPREVDLLFRELLIGVTQFFRDPLTFEALQSTVIRRLLQDKGAEEQIRIWVPGCATGEEVYSIAILVREVMARQGLTRKVHIFGTDIDTDAISVARAARYHKKMEGVSRERLERWFTRDGEEYSPVREIREMCIFSVHSAIKDPPFSKLDLISCRNLLIYLEAVLQDRLMQTFHYALGAGGYLCLGQSESVTRKAKFFVALDKKHRIFRRRETSAAAPDFRTTAPVATYEPATLRAGVPVADPIDAEARRVMEKHSPAYVIIDRHHEILRFSGGEVGRYLEPSPGTASLNLFDIVRKALRPAVRLAVQRAYKAAESVTTVPTTVKIEGKNRSIRLIVEPIAGERGAEAGYWVVAFQEIAIAATGQQPKAPAGARHPDVQALEQELQTTKTQLRATIDELETSNEEMKSANEEYQSVNEELQTINVEMGSKNEMLTRLNSNLKNLLDGTQIATIFLDKKLLITYFTPAMTDLFHLRESDYGRPITDLVTRMHYADLRRDVAKALRTLAVIEHEVRIDEDQTVFLMRIRPYRTVENVIDGVVITFVDITDRKRHQEARAQLAAIVDSSQDAIVGHTLDGTITNWNAGAQAIFGYTAAEAIGKPFAMLVPRNQGDDVPQIPDRLRRGERVEHFEIDLLRKDGQAIDVSLSVSPIKDADGKIVAASSIAREFTQRKLAEDQKNTMMGELEHRINNTLAIVSALIAQTAKSVDSPVMFAKDLQGRIQALSRVQTLLGRDRRDRAALRDVIAGELHPYQSGKDHRIVIDGNADVVLTTSASQTLAMALHELATNATKYGALSTPDGRLAVSWRVANSVQDPQLSIEWIESDGPPVTPPTRRGFGSQMIERMVTSALKAKVQRDFRHEGVRCKIEFPLTDRTGCLLSAAQEKKM